MASRGAGKVADPNAPVEAWAGRRAQEYVVLTLNTYGRICWLCGLPGATTADHIIPIDKGGAVYDYDNLGPAHGKCNYARGNRDAEGPAAVIESGVAFFSRK